MPRHQGDQPSFKLHSVPLVIDAQASVGEVIPQPLVHPRFDLRRRRRVAAQPGLETGVTRIVALKQGTPKALRTHTLTSRPDVVAQSLPQSPVPLVGTNPDDAVGLSTTPRNRLTSFEEEVDAARREAIAGRRSIVPRQRSERLVHLVNDRRVPRRYSLLRSRHDLPLPSWAPRRNHRSARSRSRGRGAVIALIRW